MHALFGFARVSGLDPAQDVPGWVGRIEEWSAGPLRVSRCHSARSRSIGGRQKFLTRCEGRGGGRARSGRHLSSAAGIRQCKSATPCPCAGGSAAVSAEGVDGQSTLRVWEAVGREQLTRSMEV